MTAIRLLARPLFLALLFVGCGGSSGTDAGVDAADAPVDTSPADASGDGATCLPDGAQTPDCTSESAFLCCSHRVGASGANPDVCHCG